MNKIIQIIREREDKMDKDFSKSYSSNYAVCFDARFHCPRYNDLQSHNKATIIAILEEILKETDKHNYFFVIDEALKELRSEMDKPSKK